MIPEEYKHRFLLSEKTLQDSKELFRYIAEFTPLAISIINQYGNYEYLNPKFVELFKYTLEDIPTGKQWFKLAYPDPHYRRKVIKSWIEDVERLGPNAIRPRVYNVTCKDGSQKEIYFRPVLMDNGKHLVISEDITEQKQAGQKMADYTRELEQLYRILNEELNKARKVHERTLPRALPAVEGISFVAHYQPAQKLGGDFYDVLLSDNKLILYLSDVSGHGLDGAMLSVFIKHTIKNFINFTDASEISPAAILRFLAKQYGQENYPEDYFISIFMAMLDLDSMELTYCGTGFQDTPLVRLGDGTEEKLATKGLFITSFFPAEMMRFEEACTSLTPGSTIFFNTDGLTEQSVNGEYYRNRLSKTFYDHAQLSPHQVAQAVVDDFRCFNNGSLQGKDDVTFLVLHIDSV